MSKPPLHLYALTWLLLALAIGAGAWFLWHRAGVAAAAGVGLGFAGLLILIRLSGSPRTPGPRDPDDPRA